jgi:membrane-associated phospholipid phosphatase
MRVAEWIQLTFVSLVTVAAWIFPVDLARQRQLKVAALAAVAITTILAVRFTIPFFSTPSSFSVVRDWLPAVLLLVPYWQIGQFFRSPNQNLQKRLAALDRFLFAIPIQHPARKRLGTALALYLELAYLIAYPLIPLGLAVLYGAGLRHDADQYWAAVLLATYVCLAVTPFVQALPPRMLADYITFDIPPTKIRALNQWILGRSSIQAITFPSAHVAASMAASLVLLVFVPWVGLVFTWLAVSIAVAAVVGGYHYAADVLLALLIVVLVFLGLHWLW